MLNKKVAICAVIKDEHQYLEEWIVYHQSIGIEYIHLYEDDGSESHLNICSKFNNIVLNKLSNFVTWKKDVNKQINLYNRFILKYFNIYDYVFFIDLDEFVTFAEGCDLQDLIKICDKTGAVLLYWKYYGANGIINNPNASVLNTFTKSVDIDTTLFSSEHPYKSFVKLKGSVKNNYMKHHHIHQLAVPIDKNKYKVCWINHYITKSWEEWIIRILKRGQIIKDFRKIDMFFVYNYEMIPIKDTLFNMIDEILLK